MAVVVATSMSLEVVTRQRAIGAVPEVAEDAYPGIVKSMTDNVIEHMEAGGMPGHHRSTVADELERWETARA